MVVVGDLLVVILFWMSREEGADRLVMACIALYAVYYCRSIEYFRV